MKKIIPLFIIFISLFSITSYAHSGRTDSNGGHYNRSTGEYHYHHGYSAHQHPNGICPYENDKSRNENNSNSSSGLLKVNSDDSQYINRLKEENNDLKNKISDINSQIYNMNATSINDVANTMKKQENEIKTLENDKTNMWVAFIFLVIITYIIGYNIGKSKE